MRKLRTRKLAVEQISKKLKDLMISSRVMNLQKGIQYLISLVLIRE